MVETRRVASIEETQSYLGTQVEFEGVDDVTRSDIRRKLEVYCFDCPLHYDSAVAKAHGFRDIIAPLAMVPLWAQPPNWAPGQPSIFGPGKKELGGRAQLEVPTPFSRGFNASAEVENIGPLYPGDHLHGTTQLIEVKPRETRVGNGVFLTTETRLWKSSGELVWVNRSTGYRYDPSPERLTSMKPEAPEKTPVAQVDLNADNPDVDWTRQIRFGDVVVGDAVPPYSVWLSYQRIVMSVANDRMWGTNHYNRDAARAGGLDDIIFNTRGYEMMFEITLRRWMGLDGRIKKMGPFRMNRSSHPGDTITGHAKVTGKEVVDGQGLVYLEIGVDNPRTEAAKGEATVTLPM